MMIIIIINNNNIYIYNVHIHIIPILPVSLRTCDIFTHFSGLPSSATLHGVLRGGCAGTGGCRGCGCSTGAEACATERAQGATERVSQGVNATSLVRLVGCNDVLLPDTMASQCRSWTRSSHCRTCQWIAHDHLCMNPLLDYKY